MFVLGPKWETLIEAHGGAPAVEVLFVPPSRAMKRRAAAAMRTILADAGDPPDLETVNAALDVYSRTILAEAIRAWKGIGDAGGAPAPVNPDMVALFLDDDRLFGPAHRLYVEPILDRDREKNASPASPSGIGEAATPAKTIAARSAAPAKKGAAKNARTPSTRSRRPKPRKSGRS
jgi:hypothetical protein